MPPTLNCVPCVLGFELRIHRRSFDPDSEQRATAPGSVGRWIPRTQARYDNAKSENVIQYLSEHARSEEPEQIGHEEDGLKVLRMLEAEGWMKVLFPAWTSARADEAKLTALHDLAWLQLLVQGIHPDMSAAQMQLLTCEGCRPAIFLRSRSLCFARASLSEEWNKLDSLASGVRQNAAVESRMPSPRATFKLFTSYDPEAVLWLCFTSKDKAVPERYTNFLKVWPECSSAHPTPADAGDAHHSSKLPDLRRRFAEDLLSS